MSTLMFWNKQNANNNANQSGDAKNGKKEWLHTPDALVNGHVAYLVKFLGATPVDQAKGIETVKDAIRRLQFSQQIKKAEGTANGKKSHKVELTISVDGVAVQEPRVQKVLHQFPLHDISYCADEKGVKKFFSFIAKTSKKDGSAVPSSNGDTKAPSADDTHTCFVFISSKLASDITMTIGQAFELAYRRYVSDGTKGGDAVAKLHVQNKQLENSVGVYQQRLKDLVELLPKDEVARLLAQYGVRDMLEVQPLENGALLGNGHNGRSASEMGTDVLATNGDDQLLIETSPKLFAPLVPPRNQLQNQINSTLDAFKPSVGTKLEGLLLHSDSDSDFDPRADESDTSSSHTNGNGKQTLSNDLFGFEPPKTLGQQLFTVPTAGNGLVNGTNGGAMVNGNGNGYQANPPPLLAPPPKAVTPRRPAANNNNIINHNGSQDLFGSTPFNALQPSPFDQDDDSTTSFSSSTAPSNNSSAAGDAFGSSIRDAVTLFARAPAVGVANPFGDHLNARPSDTVPSSSVAGFDDSFDGGFASGVPTRSAPVADPFAALATSSPTTNVGSDLSGINFSSSSASSPPVVPEKRATLEPMAYAKPNYQAFYSVSSMMNTPAEKAATDKTATKSAVSATASLDIFQSVAASAFQQFGNAVPTGGGFAKKSGGVEVTAPNGGGGGRMAFNSGLAAKSPETGYRFGGGGVEQNNFNTKTMAFDDFTLESLDPLRK